MKVRWMAGSIRFRITPSELATLEQGDAVTETLSVPGGRGWIAKISPGAPETRLCGDDAGTITLYLAATDLSHLCDPGMEGVYFSAKPEAADCPRFFIEKDFPCIHPRPEEVYEETETFTAPPDFAERHRRDNPGC